MTVWRRIQRSVSRKLDLGTVICFELPRSLPIVLLDAKYFLIRRQAHTLYVAFDPIRAKPVAWVLLPKNEIREGYEMILEVLKLRKLPTEAIVSDWHTSIRGAVALIFPQAVHQRCAAHALQEVFRKVNGRKLCARETGRDIWKVFRQIAIGFDNENDARRYLERMRKKLVAQEKGFQALDKSLHGIYEFTRREDLNIPRTSNYIENFMGVLEQRLKTFRSVKCPKSLLNILSQFIKIKYKSPTKK
ncbi:MAG: transposase [Candidatus Paceibacterota bacterium]|jgi:transposase-like protein